MRHIAILVHRFGELDETGYFLRAISHVWREQGIKVSVVQGPNPRVRADVAIMHVDLTVVPQDHLDYLQRFPTVLNAGVRDISKSFISQHLVTRGDGYTGPVIVKTDRNYGGRREAELSASTSRMGRYVRGFRRRLPWSMGAELDVWNYPIYRNQDDVPRAVWFNPDLIVERFLPERREGYYCLRTWTFLGDQERNVLMYANVPVIKAKVAIKKEEVPVPEELREIRAELGFDFGRFDYGIINGKVVLYDANRTPVMGELTPEYVPVVHKLARGIDAFFDDERPYQLFAKEPALLSLAA